MCQMGGWSQKARIAAELRDEIRAGRYRPGDRLPSVGELCARFTVTQATAVYAVRILVDEGWVISEQGRGYFAASHPPADDIAGAEQAIDQAMEALRQARARLLSNCSPDRREELVQ
jgi:GntR family transcriptional regulator